MCGPAPQRFPPTGAAAAARVVPRPEDTRGLICVFEMRLGRRFSAGSVSAGLCPPQLGPPRGMPGLPRGDCAGSGAWQARRPAPYRGKPGSAPGAELLPTESAAALRLQRRRPAAAWAAGPPPGAPRSWRRSLPTPGRRHEAAAAPYFTAARLQAEWRLGWVSACKLTPKCSDSETGKDAKPSKHTESN